MAEVLGQAAAWWLALSVAGAAAFPVAGRLFAFMPDRGAALARPVGLLVVGYLVWILASFGIAPPDRAVTVLAVALVGAGAWWAFGRHALLALRGGWRWVLSGEAVLASVFLFWVVVRAFNPEISGTEKPMEMAFLQAAMRAESFPPADPWLAGHTISYYYYGFVLTGLVAKLSGTTGSVAFNLGVATSAGLAAAGAWGVSTAIVRRLAPARTALAAGVASSFLLVFSGNLVGALDAAYARGMGDPAFWRSVQIDGFRAAYASPIWRPVENWWWWKSTRVINTFRDGAEIDYTISEFPAFSFLLGDLHPHVMALPFTVLAVGVAAAALFGPPLRIAAWREQVPAVLLCAGLVGALGFLNPWDLPAFGVLVTLAALARAGTAAGWSRAGVLGGVAMVGVGVLAAAALYAPFYASFSSQANGLRLVSVAATQPLHLLLFWGVLAIPVLGVAARVGGPAIRAAGTLPWLAAASPLAAWLLAAAIAAFRGEPSALAIAPAKLLVAVPLVGLVGLAGAALVAAREEADRLLGLAIAGAAMLVLGAELFYVADVFGNRMNTVFKLYYQAWTLAAVAGGALVAILLSAAWPLSARLALGIGATAAVLAGGYYTPAAVWSKTDDFTGPATLDGLASARAELPDDSAAIDWLRAQPPGVVLVEAVGGQYSEFGRVSARSGVPTILGWPGHEAQWRGSDRLFVGRESAVDALYAAAPPDQVRGIMAQYGATLLFVGNLERAKYGPVVDRFAEHMRVAFRRGDTIVYAAP